MFWLMVYILVYFVWNKFSVPINVDEDSNPNCEVLANINTILNLKDICKDPV